jgi:hypothetical protein
MTEMEQRDIRLQLERHGELNEALAEARKDFLSLVGELVELIKENNESCKACPGVSRLPVPRAGDLEINKHEIVKLAGEKNLSISL